MRTRYRAYTPNTRRFASGWLRQAPPGVLEAFRGNTLPPAVRQLFLQARGPDELDTTAAAVEDEAMEETAVITVFWAEGAAMPTADEIYFLGLMLVAGAPDMQLDLVAWSADVLAIQGPEFAEMQHLWRSPKAAADPGWWRRSSQLSMIIKNLPEKELLRCSEALSVRAQAARAAQRQRHRALPARIEGQEADGPARHLGQEPAAALRRGVGRHRAVVLTSGEHLDIALGLRERHR